MEPTHTARIVALRDQLILNWQSCRQIFNRMPVQHESWEYFKSMTLRRIEGAFAANNAAKEHLQTSGKLPDFPASF
jgi:hypothetical protein